MGELVQNTYHINKRKILPTIQKEMYTDNCFVRLSKQKKRKNKSRETMNNE